MNAYQQRGYTDRDDYLRHLSEDYGVELDEIRRIANMYTPQSDFTIVREHVERAAAMNYEVEMGLELL